MEVIRQLLKIALVALVALLAVAGVLALIFGLGAGGLTIALSPAGTAAGVFAVALLAGAIPALLIAPFVYFYFWRSNRATWGSAVIAGAIGGALIGLLDRGVMGYAIPSGIAVAILTHLGARRWLGPNNSFKPKPLRGSA